MNICPKVSKCNYLQPESVSFLSLIIEGKKNQQTGKFLDATKYGLLISAQSWSKVLIIASSLAGRKIWVDKMIYPGR